MFPIRTAWTAICDVMMVRLAAIAPVARAGFLIGVAVLGSLPCESDGQEGATKVEAPASAASAETMPKAGGSATGSSDSESPALLDMYWASGTIGIVITLLSMVAVGFVVEHCITIRRGRLVPDDVLETVGGLISQGRLDEAMQYCDAPQNDSLITSVVLAGLERYRSSEFGFAEYKSAMEEAGA